MFIAFISCFWVSIPFAATIKALLESLFGGIDDFDFRMILIGITVLFLFHWCYTVWTFWIVILDSCNMLLISGEAYVLILRNGIEVEGPHHFNVNIPIINRHRQRRIDRDAGITWFICKCLTNFLNKK
ncbi:hypothetical protein PMAYCL1PPCAC_04751, partial [Pristionchus mayeri]